MQTCLLLIDAQESFRFRPHFAADDFAAYLTAQNALLRGCVAAGVPVVRVLHCDGPQSPDNPFAMSSGHVRPLPELDALQPAAEFVKSRHSALVGTGLDVWLIRHGVRRLIISGIRTEQCCETTARHASDLGWEIDFVPDATLTSSLHHPEAPALSAADIKQRTIAALRDRFATICSVEQALQRAGAQG